VFVHVAYGYTDSIEHLESYCTECTLRALAGLLSHLGLDLRSAASEKSLVSSPLKGCCTSAISSSRSRNLAPRPPPALRYKLFLADATEKPIILLHIPCVFCSQKILFRWCRFKSSDHHRDTRLLAILSLAVAKADPARQRKARLLLSTFVKFRGIRHRVVTSVPPTVVVLSPLIPLRSRLALAFQFHSTAKLNGPNDKRQTTAHFRTQSSSVPNTFFRLPFTVITTAYTRQLHHTFAHGVHTLVHSKAEPRAPQVRSRIPCKDTDPRQSHHTFNRQSMIY